METKPFHSDSQESVPNVPEIFKGFTSTLFWEFQSVSSHRRVSCASCSLSIVGLGVVCYLLGFVVSSRASLPFSELRVMSDSRHWACNNINHPEQWAGAKTAALILPFLKGRPKHDHDHSCVHLAEQFGVSLDAASFAPSTQWDSRKTQRFSIWCAVNCRFHLMWHQMRTCFGNYGCGWAVPDFRLPPITSESWENICQWQHSFNMCQLSTCPKTVAHCRPGPPRRRIIRAHWTQGSQDLPDMQSPPIGARKLVPVDKWREATETVGNPLERQTSALGGIKTILISSQYEQRNQNLPDAPHCSFVCTPLQNSPGHIASTRFVSLLIEKSMDQIPACWQVIFLGVPESKTPNPRIFSCICRAPLGCSASERPFLGWGKFFDAETLCFRFCGRWPLLCKVSVPELWHQF